MEAERQEAIARDRERMEEKIEEEKKLKEMLKQQMLEIRARDTEVLVFLYKIFFNKCQRAVNKCIHYTVKPLNKGHPRERQHMVFIDK